MTTPSNDTVQIPALIEKQYALMVTTYALDKTLNPYIYKTILEAIRLDHHIDRRLTMFYIKVARGTYAPKQLPVEAWHEFYSECIDCGQTKYRHRREGLCSNCITKQWRIDHQHYKEERDILSARERRRSAYND